MLKLSKFPWFPFIDNFSCTIKTKFSVITKVVVDDIKKLTISFSNLKVEDCKSFHGKIVILYLQFYERINWRKKNSMSEAVLNKPSTRH